ncbi:CPBP family intramembrane glutamic endopeptidase [Haloprofundus salinisoli]|uniref:CPBP family intramembrane glutamic endopeptidase n=1 Tax=Haloprofundus salinisoli TaxID=2876193 RepID=UPI001CCEB155|nr:type II CAAX endopeptidase family protein [Haloprofundus salinisoli]
MSSTSPTTSSTTVSDEPGGGRSSTRGRVVALLVAVGLLVASFVVGTIASAAVIVPLLFLGLGVTSAAVLVLGTIPQQLAFAGIGALYARRRLASLPIRRPDSEELRFVVGATIAAVALASGLSYALTLTDLEPVESVIGEVAQLEPLVLLALAALSIVLVAPAEELLFRGAIQGRLRTAYGPVAGVGLASAIFASIHVFNYVGSPVAVVAATGVIFVTGSILGIAYERTGNLAVPILIHAAYNTTLFAIAYVQLVAL